MRYDIVQTTFLLSMAANGASGISATQTELQKYLELYLNGSKASDKLKYQGFFSKMNPELAGGDWKVVWGPCVYSVDDKVLGEATNAMYVAYSDTLSTHVVAIAATNFKSLNDWLKQDLDVDPKFMAKWRLDDNNNLPFKKEDHEDYVPPLPVAISAATAQGLSNLLTKLKDSAQGPIDKFLARVVKEKPDKGTLIFCGHSLAGALSPALALHLYPQPETSGWARVLVLPTAGATPGNKPFAELFNATYPSRSADVDHQARYQTWNTNYANSRDAVPHAWNQLNKVVQAPDEKGYCTSIYGVMSPDVGEPLYLKCQASQEKTKRGYYTDINRFDFEPDWGQWQKDSSKPPKPVVPYQWIALPTYDENHPIIVKVSPTPDKNVDDLAPLVSAAHIDQYQNFFGVKPLPPRPGGLSTEG